MRIFKRPRRRDDLRLTVVTADEFDQLVQERHPKEPQDPQPPIPLSDLADIERLAVLYLLNLRTSMHDPQGKTPLYRQNTAWVYDLMARLSHDPPVTVRNRINRRIARRNGC